ncbi:uncharacterized protein [Amphiura filiformis]|uniref:uncharacterized protein n=1 Tax=Amphiura filiformis TaxID=82378 RepID=UPI003B227957
MLLFPFPSQDSDFCRSFGTEEYFDVTKQSLLYFDDPANKIFTNDYNGVNLTLKVKLSILYTLLMIISKCLDNRNVYRRANIIPTLSMMGKENMEVKTLSLLILSYVVDEEENEMLTKSEDAIRFLTELFIKTVYSTQHMLDSTYIAEYNVIFVYSTSELLDALNHLAVNDSNKLEILKHGGVPAIIRMLQSDFTKEEKELAIKALWNLAFVDNIRANSEVQKAKSALRQLARSEDKSLSDASSYALWEISGHREGISTTRQTDYPPSYEETVRSDSESTHLMLSYQWDHQETVRSIGESLTRAGYKIWMDIFDMSGNTLDAMAEAVETSSAFIMCATEKYKMSRNCRSEAEYAMELNKPIIPLRLEADYKPDGWLGLALGKKLYFEFYSDDEMTTSMQKLIKEIEKRGLKRQCDEADGAAGVVPIQASIQEASPSRSPTTQSKKPTIDISNWTNEDVQTWLQEKGIPQMCSPLSFYTGSHLTEMYEQYKESKQEVKNELKSAYNLDFDTLIKFTTALAQLFK